MKTLLLVALMASALVTSKAEAKDLSDFMSPAEMAEELSEDTSFQPLNFTDMLFFASAASAPRLEIIVNKAQAKTAQDAQTLEAFLDGELLYRTTVSTGKEKWVQTPPSAKYPQGRKYFAKTPVGTYKITRRSRNHVSGTWPGASMPFAQFFVGGIAIHATTPDHFGELGKRDSGGCVRLHPRDARLMWDLVGMIGVPSTQVTVYDGTKSAHPLGRAGEIPRYDNDKTMLNIVKSQEELKKTI